MSKVKDEMLERFFTFVDRLKGRKDVKKSIDVLTDPPNLATMSILNRGQMEFCSIAEYVANVEEWGGLFDGLNDFAKAMKSHSISNKGTGREQAIRYVSAMNAPQILRKLGLTANGEEKKE